MVQLYVYTNSLLVMSLISHQDSNTLEEPVAEATKPSEDASDIPVAAKEVSEEEPVKEDALVPEADVTKESPEVDEDDGLNLSSQMHRSRPAGKFLTILSDARHFSDRGWTCTVLLDDDDD